jgi:hypothetical protein
MPGVPNEVVFARTAAGAAITWGQVRANADRVYRVQCLADRLRSFMVLQYRELQQKNINGPFILGLTVMAGVEILGKIFYSTPIPTDPNDANKEAFCRFCAKLDQRFGRTPPKAFKNAFEARWAEARPDRISVIFYRYFRNTLIHGYYGRAVFLTGQGTNDLLLRDDGCLLVHPDWLLERFIAAAEVHIAELLAAAPNSSLRRNGLNYLHGLLDEPADEA